MPSLETSLAFFACSLLLILTPGPDSLFVVVTSVSRGRRTGILVVLGLCSGLIVHTLAVAVGLAALFAASALAFHLLKFAGAGYLLYLAWHGWQAAVNTGFESAVADQPPTTGWQLYGQAVVIDLTNPKVAMFFLAFLPQFVRHDAGLVAIQLIWFGLAFSFATLIVFTGIACLASFLGDSIRKSVQARQYLCKAAACAYGGLAIKLATSQR